MTTEPVPPDPSPLITVADGHARFVPDLPVSAAVRDLHESRYAWVTTTFDLAGTRVLDLGCGSGYGARHLASVASEVVAADVSAAAVAYAAHRYPAANVRPVLLDPADPLGATPGIAPVDLVMSAEVLEHVRNPFAHVADIASVLAEDGVAVVCTPNRWFRYTSNRGGLLDPSHVMEFTPDALVGLLAGWFTRVELWFQVWPLASATPATPRGLPRRVARGARRAAGTFLAEVRPGRAARARASGPTHDPHDDPHDDAADPGLRPLAEYRSTFLRATDPAGEPPPGAIGLVAVGRDPRPERVP